MSTALLQEAFEWTTGVVKGIDPGQLDQPTPCEGWSVRMLLNHMVGANRGFATGVPAGNVDPKCDPTVDQLGGDPAATYAGSWPGVVDAWTAADPEGMTELPWGPMPNMIASQLLLLESTVHGWDLARATGQDPTIPASLAGPVLELVTMLFADPANRGEDFQPAVEVEDGASVTTRLVAFLGRRP